MATPTISTSQPYEWTFRRVVVATVVFSFVAFCFYLLFRFYEVVFILFIAIVIGTVIRPIANWLTQRGLSRMASVIVVYLAIFIFIAGFLWLLFPSSSSRERQFLERFRVITRVCEPGLSTLPASSFTVSELICPWACPVYFLPPLAIRV